MGGTNTVYHDAVKDSDLVGRTNAKGIFVEKGSEENIFVIKFYFVSSKSDNKMSYIAGPEYQVVLDLR